MTDRKFPTADEVHAKLTEARNILDTLTVHRDGYTIDDYPSGRYRVLCKLEVEMDKKKGFRTVRTTTNKHGGWCKPKKSTYRHSVIHVVTGEAIEKEAAWLNIGFSSIGLQSASGSWTLIAEAPCCGEPRREEHRYTVTVSHSSFGANGLEATGEDTVEHKVLPADPPELCDAWDAWKEGVKEISRWFAARHTKQEVA